MHLVYLLSSSLQKTSKIIIPEDSQSQWVYNYLVCLLKKNLSAFLRYLLPANLKQVGFESKFGPEKVEFCKISHRF